MTAVEYLFEEILKLESEYYIGNIGRIDLRKKRLELFEQAKEMEIKQSHDYAEFAIKFSEYCALYSYKNRNMYGEMLHAPTKYDDLYTTKELLEKFKNTNNDSN
jgi:hypothetical protein